MLNIIAGSLSVGAAPVLPNSYESIATSTVGAGGASYIEFTSIPSGFEHLQIRAIILPNTTSGNTNYLQLNGDTGNNYAWHLLRNAASLASTSGPEGAAISMYGGTNVAGPVIFDILDYKNTNKYKTVRGIGGLDDNTNGFINLTSGLWQNTNAVTSIKIYNAADFKQYSHFALYGIKGS